jgi:hypothetical protein
MDPIVYDSNPADFTDPSGYATGVYPVNGQSLTPWNIDELNPSLTWPGNVRIFSQMRTDSQIDAATRAIHLTIRKVPWRIDPAGADPKFVAALAADLGLPILGEEASVVAEATRVSFTQHLREALEATTYGHMPFEITVAIEDGMVRLARLDVRHPSTITRIITDAQGKILEVWQSGTGAIPGARMCWYRVGGIGAVPQGVSMLRSAYKPWSLKDRLERILVMTDERNGMGIPHFKLSEGATDEQVSNAEKAGRALRAGDTASVVTKGDSEFRLVGVEGKLPDILPHIEYQNKQIAKSTLAMFLELGASSEGSHALGEVQIDLFRDSCQAMANDLGDQFTQQVIRPLTVWSQGEDAKIPRLVPGLIGVDSNIPPAVLGLLVEAGVVTPDKGLETHVRQLFGMPAADDPDAPRTGALVKPPTHMPPEPKADNPGASNF